MAPMDSNWEAVVNVVAARTPNAARVESRLLGCIELAEAGAMIGEATTHPDWRRRLLRRLRALEKEHHVEILVSRRGREGAMVRLEGLYLACPVPVAAALAVQELRERCVALERRLAVVEREIGGPASTMRPKTGRK
ncbi:hypothetical protein GF068_42990 [Polyangium spumosum]|uniref:Uncharacterized protein n=2 Tax=Polyangium spumosum TaxID=889282 RepID=A0A6N7Q2Z3_9BACT|nr:hypothetical protein [Polyangium spumosum]